MGKHLEFHERRIIEEGLHQHKSFAEIARQIGRHRSTVKREVYAHPQTCQPRGIVCRNHKTCNQKALCTYRHCKLPSCRYHCPRCQQNCPEFDEIVCPGVERYPYGCNGCSKTHCSYRRKVYSAKHAQSMYERNLSEARKGISLSEEEFQQLDELFTSRLSAGQSISVIAANHKDVLPVSERTVYSYLAQGLLGADPLALRRTVQRKHRKKSGPIRRIDQQCHKGRSYEEYENYTVEHPETTIQQMDTVIGHKGGKCLLTILFTNCGLQLMYLRDRNTSKSVTEIFRHLRATLGEQDFSTLFQTIVTDRGTEFTDPNAIEVDSRSGEMQCRVFYCDPRQSNQKSHCERNHELIRYVIPKGTSMNGLTQEKVTQMMNHINSYPRAKWNYKSPYDVFVSIYGDRLAAKLGLKKIQADAVILRPQLVQ